MNSQSQLCRCSETRPLKVPMTRKFHFFCNDRAWRVRKMDLLLLDISSRSTVIKVWRHLQQKDLWRHYRVMETRWIIKWTKPQQLQARAIEILSTHSFRRYAIDHWQNQVVKKTLSVPAVFLGFHDKGPGTDNATSMANFFTVDYTQLSLLVLKVLFDSD